MSFFYYDVLIFVSDGEIDYDEKNATKIIKVSEYSFGDAARTGRFETLEYLIQKMKEQENSTSVSKFLFSEKGINVNNLLYIACNNGHLKVADMLIQHGANINGNPLTTTLCCLFSHLGQS